MAEENTDIKGKNKILEGMIDEKDNIIKCFEKREEQYAICQKRLTKQKEKINMLKGKAIELANELNANKCLLDKEKSNYKNLFSEHQNLVEEYGKIDLEFYLEEIENKNIKLSFLKKEINRLTKDIVSLKENLSVFEEAKLDMNDDFLLRKIRAYNLKKLRSKNLMISFKKIKPTNAIIQKKFFGFTINSKLDAIIKDASQNEFCLSDLLTIDPRTEKNKKLQKILLYFVSYVCSKIGGFSATWYRNHIAEMNHNISLRNTHCIRKFYYTYINPLNKDTEISYNDYIQMHSTQRRIVFQDCYKKFDQENHKTISLFTCDSLWVLNSFKEIKQLV